MRLAILIGCAFWVTLGVILSGCSFQVGIGWHGESAIDDRTFTDSKKK